MTWTVPNFLTVSRLFAAPAVLLVFLVVPRPAADWIALLLFIGASLTDWIDGHLARRWNQLSKLGTMLDPIADKAMVIIALTAVIGLTGMNGLILVPATVILFREIFVSGLREFLGDTAGTLKVTRLAKWKTMVQMVAISVMLAFGAFASTVKMRSAGMSEAQLTAALARGSSDELGLGLNGLAADVCLTVGIGLLWLAAVLTAITGWDYFTKALPHLEDRKK